MLFSEKLNDFEKKHPCRSITVDDYIKVIRDFLGR